MKIELHGNPAPADILNQVMALMSYHEYLIGEISEGQMEDGPKERHGHIILTDLQKALIKAAMEKQHAIDRTKLKAVEA